MSWRGAMALGAIAALLQGAAHAQPGRMTVAELRDSPLYSRITQDDPACATAMAQVTVGVRDQAGLDSRSEQLTSDVFELVETHQIVSASCDGEACSDVARRELKLQAFDHLRTATTLVEDQGSNLDFLRDGLGAVRSQCAEYELDLSSEVALVEDLVVRQRDLQDQREAIRGFALH